MGSLTDQTNGRVEYQVPIMPRVRLTCSFSLQVVFSSSDRVRLAYAHPPGTTSYVSSYESRHFVGAVEAKLG